MCVCVCVCVCVRVRVCVGGGGCGGGGCVCVGVYMHAVSNKPRLTCGMTPVNCTCFHLYNSSSLAFVVVILQVVCSFPTSILFAPVAPDGYGIAYQTREHDVNLVLSCFGDCNATDIGVFDHAIKESLDRCYRLLPLFPVTSKV